MSIAVLRNGNFLPYVGRIEFESGVAYAIIDENEKEKFLDNVAQYYRSRAEELLFERKGINR